MSISNIGSHFDAYLLRYFSAEGKKLLHQIKITIMMVNFTIIKFWMSKLSQPNASPTIRHLYQIVVQIETIDAKWQ